jgi:N-acetylglucosaminyl-diphospho-decaprenol L-rhamnosyltransferase
VTATVARADVVVVSHDTRYEALACLATLGQAGASRVVLVDSGSTDGTAAAVRAAHPDVDVVELDNVGYGRAANAGVDRCDAPVVVLCNADTRFAPGSVTRLAEALAADPQLAAVGPQVRYPDGRMQASARTVPPVWVAAGHALLGLWRPDNPFTRRYRMADADPDVARDADWLSGCALAVRRDAFGEIGGFDSGYFMYVEDVDLGRRLRERGWRLRYEPSARVVHAVGASTSRRPARMVLHHARSLDRYYGATLGRRGAGRLARPIVRVALGLWAVLAIVWGRMVGRRSGRSSTGE